MIPHTTCVFFNPIGYLLVVWSLQSVSSGNNLSYIVRDDVQRMLFCNCLKVFKTGSLGHFPYVSLKKNN